MFFLKGGQIRSIFAHHYESFLKISIFPDQQTVRDQYLGVKENRICRFCTASPGQGRTFKDRAHAIPEFFGNRRLFSYYECDGCNSFFSRLEDSAAKYFQLDLTLNRVEGKRGVPKFKSQRKDYYVRDDAGGLVVALEDLSPGVVVRPLRREIQLNWIRHPYRPLAVYKTLLKIALTLIPDQEVANFFDSYSWLRRPLFGINSQSVINPSAYVCSTNQEDRGFHFSLLRRKRHVDFLPYMFMYVEFCRKSYMSTVPSPKRDSSMILPLPHPDQLKFPTLTQVDWSSNAILRFDRDQASLTYKGESVTKDVLMRKWLNVAWD